jgi:SulP family sulfate permease
MLVPKLVTTLRTYDRTQLGADLSAGVIVGIVALPLAIAFAIASGVGPSRGLYTAIVAGFIISALGGSRVQIGGPTGAFVVIVYGIVQKYGVDGLIVATMMAGVILVILGVARLGSVIKFIPHPVVIGFTSGIAVIIFSGEIKDLFGLRMGGVPADFVEKVTALAAHAGALNWYAVGISALTLAIIILWPRVNERIPGTFVALIAVTALTQLAHLPVETIGTRFGSINAALPHPVVPHLTLAQLRGLVAPAFTIAMLGAVESLLSAVVSDGMIGSRHRSNMELVAQGVANIVTPLFGGIPATGAIARTATNVKNGGRTPVAGMTHAVTLLLITLFFGRWAGLIPMAALAGILTIVAYNMSEWRVFVAELRAPRSDVAVLLATFLLTVFVDLTVAIAVGMVGASFLFMRRMAESTNVSAVTGATGIASDEDGDEAVDPYDARADALQRRVVPDHVAVFEVNGPFFFGAAEGFRQALGNLGHRPRALVIRLRNVPVIDSSGMHALHEVVRRARQEHTLVLLSELAQQPRAAMTKSGLLAEIGAANVFDSMQDALVAASRHAGLPEVAAAAS